jgi:hypothetical protein
MICIWACFIAVRRLVIGCHPAISFFVVSYYFTDGCCVTDRRLVTRCRVIDYRFVTDRRIVTDRRVTDSRITDGRVTDSRVTDGRVTDCCRIIVCRRLSTVIFVFLP